MRITELYQQINTELSWIAPAIAWGHYARRECGGEVVMGPHITVLVPRANDAAVLPNPVKQRIVDIFVKYYAPITRVHKNKVVRYSGMHEGLFTEFDLEVPA